MAVQHGSRTKYNQGCRCDACVQASRDYNKARAQKIRAEKHGPARPATVTKLPTAPKLAAVPEYEPGRVEAGVMAEIGALSTVASRQGLVEIAIALARVLDSPLAIAQHASAAHRLSETLDKLRKGADGRTGRLAAVRSMTRQKATG